MSTPESLGRADLALANVGVFALCVLAFRFPVWTALGVVLAWDLLLVASRVAPSLLGGGAPKGPWTDPAVLRSETFLSLFAPNGVVAVGVLYLFVTGFATESQEAPLAFGAWLALSHFFVGFGLLLLAITYAVLKFAALRGADDGPGAGDVVLEQIAALAFFVFLAFGLQLLPVIVPVAAPMGALGFTAFVVALLVQRRRRTYATGREQGRALIRALLTAPFVAVVLLFFGASPVRTHFLVDIGYEMHFTFAGFTLIPVLTQPLVAALSPKRRRGAVRTFVGVGARTMFALILAMGVFLGGLALTESGLDPMPAYDLLLPPAQR